MLYLFGGYKEACGKGRLILLEANTTGKIVLNLGWAGAIGFFKGEREMGKILKPDFEIDFFRFHLLFL